MVASEGSGGQRVSVVRFAGYELDEQRAELRGADGALIRLRPKTFEMLRLFAASGGRVLSKPELMEAVWPNIHVGEDGLFQCIREIRAALGDEQRQIIKLVSGRGYLFAPAVSVVATQSATVSATGQNAPAKSPGSIFGLQRPLAIAAIAGACAIVGLAVAAAAFRPNLMFKPGPRSVAVVPIVDASDDPGGGAMAAGVTASLIDGLARIDNFGVVAQPSAAGTTSASAASDYVVHGELLKGPQSWTVQLRVLNGATGEVQSVASASIGADVGAQLQQSRLAAGVGDPLARRLNTLLDADEDRDGRTADGNAKVVVEQATASISHTTRERFDTAQTMLESALAGEPDNVDLQVALAGLQLRGIQMTWYEPAVSAVKQGSAKTLLERALQAKPRYIPVLEAYCRFLSATNDFVGSLVACAKTLSFDPWNGSARYLVGLGQLHLGRFEEALATFEQADHFDTPAVSRWTWALGAGWANLLLGRDDKAVPWLQRSIAITPASGRTYLLLAVAYQRLGQREEAKAALAKALELRPDSTALNVTPPTRNASPVFIDESAQVVQTMVEIGLPES